jgi:hypothetical protein
MCDLGRKARTNNWTTMAESPCLIAPVPWALSLNLCGHRANIKGRYVSDGVMGARH